MGTLVKARGFDMYATQDLPENSLNSPAAARLAVLPAPAPSVVHQAKRYPAVPATSVHRLADSLDYMMNHLNQPIKIGKLSAMTGVSESRFFELFKMATGHTPLNWFIRARMSWAGRLLETSQLQVKEIAGQVGYEDPFYFSRLFKLVQGISPSDYRRQKQAEGNRMLAMTTTSGFGAAMAPLSRANQRGELAQRPAV